MSATDKPAVRPRNPRFSSGPCPKHPDWSLENLTHAALGRSHRCADGKAKLKAAIELTRELLQVPATHRIAIVPGSDTGAMEMALWSLLGARGVDVLAWESFGKGWVTDVVDQLGLEDVRVLEADYGMLPDLGRVDCDRDVVFTWNGTTSGVRVPDAEWVAADRKGLTVCDATSAVFAQALDWERLDAATFSWQKVLGGEAAHGMLILSPRAVERLESHRPAWPLPKLFRLTKKGKLDEAIFEGATINTPSMLCVEDYLDALDWAASIGGLEALMARADANAAVIAAWVERTGWVEHLARDPATRSNTSVCLKLSEEAVKALGAEAAKAVPGRIARLLEAEGVAYDIGGYRNAPPGLRIWCGSTVERSDLEALTPWLDWAYAQIAAAPASAA